MPTRPLPPRPDDPAVVSLWLVHEGTSTCVVVDRIVEVRHANVGRGHRSTVFLDDGRQLSCGDEVEVILQRIRLAIGKARDSR